MDIRKQVHVNDDVIFGIEPYYHGTSGEFHDGTVTSISDGGGTGALPARLQV